MSNPMSPGPGVAHDRVQVGAVVVEGAAGVADHPGDLGDVLVEQAERVRVGEHQAGDLVVDLGAQVVEVDATAPVRRHLDHLVARHGHRGRVGAVGGVGGKHLGALLAAVGVVGAGEEQPRQLPVGARRGLKADVLEAADLGQGALQAPHQLQRSLGALRVLRGMKARVARQRGDPLVEPRVVLHRAGAERIGARVEVEVAAREAVVVADDLGLGDLGELRGALPQQLRGDQLVERALGDVERRQGRRAAPGDRALEDRGRGFPLLRGRSFGRCWRRGGSAPSRSRPPRDGAFSPYGSETRHSPAIRRRPRRARRRGGRCRPANAVR